MGVSAKETLGAGEDVSDDNCRPQRVNDVFVVWVEQETVVDVASVRKNVPEKPITALICKSCCMKVIFLKL